MEETFVGESSVSSIFKALHAAIDPLIRPRPFPIRVDWIALPFDQQSIPSFSLGSLPTMILAAVHTREWNTAGYSPHRMESLWNTLGLPILDSWFKVGS